jgi:hypothetical protein
MKLFIAPEVQNQANAQRFQNIAKIQAALLAVFREHQRTEGLEMLPAVGKALDPVYKRTISTSNYCLSHICSIS